MRRGRKGQKDEVFINLTQGGGGRPLSHTCQNGFVSLELLLSDGQCDVTEVSRLQERPKVCAEVALGDLGEVVEGAGHCEGFSNHTHLVMRGGVREGGKVRKGKGMRWRNEVK